MHNAQLKPLCVSLYAVFCSLIVHCALLIVNCAFARLTRALMGLSGLEPPTSRLSGVRSNRLSYKPVLQALKACN